MSRSLKVRDTCINTAKLAVRRSGFPSQRALSEDVGLSLATVSNFLTGKPVDRATFLELCEKLSLDSDEISDLRPDSEDASDQQRSLEQRNLTAIVFTDVVSFTPRMAANEQHTIALVQRDLQQIQLLCQQFAGRLSKKLGDGLLLYFKSAEQAVLCAIAIQQTLAEAAAHLPPEDILQHRIGIDLGDVVHINQEIMGNSVNLAARLQTEAPPGGICLSQAAYDAVQASLPIPANYAGERQLKGLPSPLPIYHIVLSSTPPLSYPSAPPLPNKGDWGEAMDVSVFYGRTEELATLEHWIIADRCRLITLIGMGGMGKTSLSIKLAEQLQSRFEFVIWRSLRNAPPLPELLADMLQFFSGQTAVGLPETLGRQITQLVKYLRQFRCLCVLDNAESILCEGNRAGAYQAGYEAYGQFFQSVGESRHQSCLLLTSREIPGGLIAKQGSTAPIRSFRLTGLAPDDAQAILVEKGLVSLEARPLIDRYSGNPLALKIASTTVQDLFDGDVSQFLAQDTVVYGDVSDLLEQQFNRLTRFEQQVMYWLTIAREPATLSDLREDILPVASQKALLESLESLQQRSLIEKVTTVVNRKTISFTQQPVVMEYVTNRLIEQVCLELCRGDMGLIDSHSLSQAQTKDYLRNTQQRLILSPVVDQLQRQLGDWAAVKACLDQTLTALKACTRPSTGYAAGNLLNLFHQLGVNLSGYDFSELTVRQVYLQGVNLRGVDFTQADLAKSVFTQTLGDILSIDFSPDSTLLATGIDQQVLLWRIADRRQIATLAGHTAWVRCVAFSPDGRLLASGSHDQTIRLWDVQTGQCLKTWRGHASGVQTVAFSPDGKRLASGSYEPDIWLWEVQTGQCVKTLRGHCDRILNLVFSPEGHLISTSDDRTIRVWDTQSDDCLQVLETHVNWLLSAALSPDGNTLVTGSDHQTVKFWHLPTGACTATLPNYQAEVWAASFSPDGQTLATGSDDKTIRWWDVNTHQCVKTFQSHTHQVWLVKFSPDGQTFVSSGEDQTVKLWDVASGHCLTTIESHSNWVAAIAFSPDDRSLASGSKDHQIRLWDLETETCTRVLTGHSDVVTSVEFSPLQGAGDLLASSSDDHTVQIWDVGTGAKMKTLWGHHGWVQAIAFSPDGQRLVSGSSDQTVRVWQLRSGECLYTLEGHQQRVKTVAFDPQGTTIASGSDDHLIKVWDIHTGSCLQTLAGHTDWVLTVAYSPDGKYLVSGSGDRTLKLWELKTGNCLRTLEGHTARVRSVAFSPDGLTLASGSEDCRVNLWTVKTGDCFQTLDGHPQIVWMVRFNHKGDQVASCSEDGTIRLWNRKTGECLSVLSADRPYEGMIITGAKGLTPAQRSTLCTLGAIAH
ncbi:MAG: adenylate/guanylate cyclase domain-containing protein [Cyanobacteria bacterium P01_A01_bin.114]